LGIVTHLLSTNYFDYQKNKIMSDKKQTAVEWLVKQINSNIDFIPIHKWDMIRDLVQQAQQMERQQIVEAFDDGETNNFYEKGWIINGKAYFDKKFNNDGSGK
jgi:hypothetical protein